MLNLWRMLNMSLLSCRALTRHTLALSALVHREYSSRLRTRACGANTCRYRAQNLEVVLDTGSSDLWVASTGCTSCPSGTDEFNTGDSSTYKSTSNSVTFQYGSGQATGDVGSDTVAMGGFSVTGATVCEYQTAFATITP